MCDRFSIARKTYRIMSYIRETLVGLSSIGFTADLNCPLDCASDAAYNLLVEHFPDIDESFFEFFFYETEKLGSEEEFINALRIEISKAQMAAFAKAEVEAKTEEKIAKVEQKINSHKCEECKNKVDKKEDNKKVKVKVFKIAKPEPDIEALKFFFGL